MLSAFSFGQMGTKVTRNKTMCKYIVFAPYNTMLKAQLFLTFDSQLFLAGNQLYDWKTHRWGWWWWCQKKHIAFFVNKQRLLSLDMKTKVVQHVPRINLSYFKFQIFKFFKIFNFFQIFKNFQIFSGSQLLSDFQTFFKR